MRRRRRRKKSKKMYACLKILVAVDLDTRIARVVVREDGTRRREALGVLIEQDLALVLDEPALLEDAVHLRPATGPALELDAGLSEAAAQGSSGLPCVVVRDLAVDVVEDVSLRDAVGGGGTDPAHDAAEVTEEVAVKSGQGSTGEGELGGTVVGQQGVGVLQESDQDEPVVDPGMPRVNIQIPAAT